MHVRLHTPLPAIGLPKIFRSPHLLAYNFLGFSDSWGNCVNETAAGDPKRVASHGHLLNQGILGLAGTSCHRTTTVL